MEHSFTQFIEENIFLVAIALGLLGAIIGVEVRRFIQKFTEITTVQAVQMINRDDAIVLDLRENHELESGTIQNAKHAAASTLTQQSEALDIDHDKPVIAFCASGARSPGICRLLAKKGFSKVYNLKGGLVAWQQAGLPIIKR